ncbi:MAG: UPF0489 family protein [Oscillospiraceae bacterium]
MIPLYILEEHNEAFAAWFAAVADGVVPRGATLLHVDHHDDMECGGYDHDFSRPVATRRQAKAFVQNAAGIADFIIPALWEGWFSAIVMVKSVVPEPFRSEKRFIRHRGGGVLRSGRSVPFVHGKYDGDPNAPYRFFTYTEGFGYPLCLGGPCVLDIDIDYFCWDDSLSTAGPKRMEITKDAWAQYQSDPHHPFRLFPRRLLRVVEAGGRHYLEYKEHDVVPPPADEAHIARRVERLCAWLAGNNIRPVYISLCRSRFSGYTPAGRWRFVESTLLEGLGGLYPLTLMRPKGG